MRSGRPGVEFSWEGNDESDPASGAGLLTDRQRQRLTALFADDRHVEVAAVWGIYQRMIAVNTAYREPNRTRSRELMSMLIDSVSQGLPKALSEVVMQGRTLNKRAADVLAYFDRPGTSNGPAAPLPGNQRPDHHHPRHRHRPARTPRLLTRPAQSQPAPRHPRALVGRPQHPLRVRLNLAPNLLRGNPR